jgi:thiol-disulfide isomerase/thioredoxin
LNEYAKGSSFKLQDHVGKKIIVLNFFASWCTSCIQELPLLHSLQEKYKDDAHFIAINVGERPGIIAKFLKKHPFRYTILEDQDKRVTKQFGVEALPKTIVINKKGAISFRGDRPPTTLP